VRKKRSKLKEYMKQIEEIKEAEKLPGKKEKDLLKLQKEIKGEFSDGLITENHYLILERELENALGDMRKAIVKGKVAIPKKLEEDMDEVLEDGTVTKDEYKDVADKIAESDDLTEEEKAKLDKLMTGWMNKGKENDDEDEILEE
jgi:hypothetical protein